MLNNYETVKPCSLTSSSVCVSKTLFLWLVLLHYRWVFISHFISVYKMLRLSSVSEVCYAFWRLPGFGFSLTRQSRALYFYFARSSAAVCFFPTVRQQQESNQRGVDGSMSDQVKSKMDPSARLALAARLLITTPAAVHRGDCSLFPLESVSWVRWAMRLSINASSYYFQGTSSERLLFHVDLECRPWNAVIW